MDESRSASFTHHGSDAARSPVVLAVPHAGRRYPRALIEAAHCTRDQLALLEDALVDQLVEPALAGGATAIIAANARAWIDLNRDPRELDPAMIAGDPGPLIASGKVRAGLGLIPRRAQPGVEIYRRRLPIQEVRERIDAEHALYHAAIAEALERARAQFGVAVLLDCHSMPPLAPAHGRPPATVVVGDRHGRSAAPRFADALADVAQAHAHMVAFNVPYAGGYTLARHGRPAERVHALQVELSRALYLDAALRSPGPGFAETARMVVKFVAALAEAALGRPERIAAE